MAIHSLYDHLGSRVRGNDGVLLDFFTRFVRVTKSKI